MCAVFASSGVAHAAKIVYRITIKTGDNATDNYPVLPLWIEVEYPTPVTITLWRRAREVSGALKEASSGSARSNHVTSECGPPRDHSSQAARRKGYYYWLFFLVDGTDHAS